MAAPKKSTSSNPPQTPSADMVDVQVRKSSVEFEKAKAPKEIKIEMVSAKELDEKKYYCTACGREYEAVVQSKNFPFSSSPFYKNNNNRLTVCNFCLDDTVEQYTEILGSQEAAIKRVCLRFDMYYDERVLESCKRSSRGYSRIKQYIKHLNLSQNKGKTFDSYLEELPTKSELEADVELTMVDSDRVASPEEEIRCISTWGRGFTAGEYRYLDSKYEQWKKNTIIDGGTREKYVRDICVIDLLQNRALLKNDTEMYQKLTTTLQTTLRNASLTPKIEDEKRETEKCMGVMIKDFEENRPIPEPLPEWKDVDGIMRVVLIYFIGHLCKMIGLKNKYAKMYEDEMEKYRPKMDDPDNAETEDVFEFLMDTGFDGVELSSKNDDSDILVDIMGEFSDNNKVSNDSNEES